MGQLKEKPKPFLFEEYCKGCGRCISACPQHCIAFGSEINAQTGVIPVMLDLEECNACGLCISSCPEPYGLQPQNEDAFELQDPKSLFGHKPTTAKIPQDLPNIFFELGETEPLVIKGTYASAIGSILAGCRHFFGYPITPSTEGAELMAKLLPMLDGVFIQAVSEVATINFMYGCGGAGLPCMTFTSSPGFSLMLEGISYLIGAEVPAVIAKVMRGGPGLGNIAPEQADIKLACRGLGHGNTQAIVLAPASPQEMLDLTILAFELAFKYRNPTIILSDGYLGQMTGKVTLPKMMKKVGIPSWAVYGDEEHRKNLICSIMLEENDLEKHNIHLNQKYQKITENEQRSNAFYCEDAEILLVASNTPSKMAKGAVEELRQKGIKIGLFRPITLYPFPINDFKPLVEKAKRLIVVEASNGQLEDEVRLALSHANVKDFPHIEHVRRFGGILPQQHEIIEQVLGK